MIAAMLVAGCEQFKSPQRIRELEDRVDKLSDEVSTLKGSPSTASRRHAGSGSDAGSDEAAGSGEGSEGAGSGEPGEGEKVAAAAPHEGSGDEGTDPAAAGKADGDGDAQEHADKAAAGEGKERGDKDRDKDRDKDGGDRGEAKDHGDREPPSDRGEARDRDRDGAKDRGEGKDRDRDDSSDRGGGKDRGDREAASDRGESKDGDRDGDGGDAKRRRDENPKARALADLRRIVSDATRASKAEPRAARSGERGKSDETRPAPRGKSSEAVDQTEPSHPPPTSQGAPHWSYDGKNGPPTWGTLDPKWRACMVGKAQSPIDIEPRAGNASPIIFHYRPAPVTVRDNGHTLEVTPAPGNSIEIDGDSYRLVQFHFHMPSEHTIAGEHYPLELHLVHQDDDGKLAVVAVMYDAGAESRALGALWSRWPRSQDADDHGKKPFDPSELLPETRTVYRYTGSLTTPPCSEGVLWNVMRRAMTDSKAHLDGFARHYPHNAREVQPRNDRRIQ